MHNLLCQLALAGSLLAADHLLAQEAAAPGRRVAIGTSAVESWLSALEGHWKWQDDNRHGEVEFRIAAGGLALVGRGKGFASGDDSNWLIYWDASLRELVITVISSSGEVHLARLEVSDAELKGKFTGTSDSADGHRAVRGECVWQREPTGAFSIVWKPWLIANRGQIDRVFQFRRGK